MKQLVTSLFLIICLLSWPVLSLAGCPSNTVYLRIISYDPNTGKSIGHSAVQVPPGFFPGNETNCPAETLVARMLEFDMNTGVFTPMPLLVEQGAVSNKDNLLNEEEIKLYKEKGIVNPPKQTKQKETNQPKKSLPPPDPKGKTTANAEDQTLRSSIY